MSKNEAPAASAVASGALSALLQDLVRGADPGSSWERALRPGAVIGRFELIRELGRGGFGIVYEARDRELGRAVALKAVRAGDQLDLREERLLREAEAAARLSHPNIVTLFDVARCEHGPYLVLELLRGQTLAQRLAQGPVPVREALRIGAAVARGLAHAHAEGVVHRDLTPGNVFLCQDGQVKVLDLGMAHAFGRRRLDGGTPGFMAPEQRRGAPEDERTDVFALGAVLYRMLAGEMPFPEDAAHRSRGHRPAPAIDVPEVPGLGPLVGRMLALDPIERPRDAAEIAAALDAFEHELGRTPAPGGTPPVVRRRSRRRAVAAIGVGCALLGAVVAIGLFWSAREPTGAGRPGAVDARAEASIAVLPFVDLSAGRDQEYLSDGIAEEILNALAQVEGLRVTSRTSSFSFKGKGDDLETIARKLHVGRVLEGSVRREGSRVRITAQLVDAEGGHHLWSETFDRELAGIFALQEEIARAVVGELKVKLLPGAAPSTQEHSTASSDAYREFLLGRQLALQGTRAGYLRAIAAFERAVAADPSYGPAWAGMANALSRVITDSPAEQVEYRRRAMDAAEKAVSTRPRLADGYAARGLVRAGAFLDWEGAEADWRRALELNPGDAATLRLHGRYVLAARGRLEDGIAVLRRSTELDPLYAPAWISLGALSRMTDLRLARAALERALELAPEDPIARFHLVTVLLLQGKAQEARTTADLIHGDDFWRLLGVALAEHSLGHAADSRRALDELTRLYSASGAYQIAYLHAWRGERELAFQWLERAYLQNDAGLGELLIEPLLRPLRGDPRFTELLRKLRLPVE